MDKNHRPDPKDSRSPQVGSGPDFESGAVAAHDAEATQGMTGETPVFDRGRAADLDGGMDDETGSPAADGLDGDSTYALSDGGQYGADAATGGGDAALLGQMGMGVAGTMDDHGGFDDEDERGQPSAPGYDGDGGDPVSADGLSGAGASYGMALEGDPGLPVAVPGVGAGFANPEETGLSSDEDTLIDDAAFEACGEEMPQPIPGTEIPAPGYQPGYGDDGDGNDVEVEIPVPPDADIPIPQPTFPGTVT